MKRKMKIEIIQFNTVRLVTCTRVVMIIIKIKNIIIYSLFFIPYFDKLLLFFIVYFSYRIDSEVKTEKKLKDHYSTLSHSKPI